MRAECAFGITGAGRGASRAAERRLRFLVLLFLALPVVTWPSKAEAQPQRSSPAYRLEIELDAPIVLVAGSLATAFFFLPETPGAVCAPCDRSRINALDRPAAGLYDTRWSTVGDIATVSTLVVPVTVVLLDEGWVNGLNDDLVLAETALVSSALQVMSSFAVARPRPRVYGSDAPTDERTDANAARSFFSGHVANTVAMSVAALRTFQRLGKPTIAWVLFGATMAGSSLVGVARVASGAHFPTDVLVGAAAGAGIGLALPAIHTSGARLVPMADTASAGLSIAGPLP
jgi:membrane-associated phospholipid phosphatase